MEKTQITTELIGLRGGLSLLSKYTDDIKTQEQEVEDARIELESLENQRENLKQDIIKGEEEYQTKVSEIQQRQTDIKNKMLIGYDKKAVEIARDRVGWGFDEAAGLGWLFVGLGVVISLVLTSVLFDILWADNDYMDISGACVIAFGIGTIIYPLITTIIWIIKRKLEYERATEAEISKFNNELCVMQEGLTQAETELKEIADTNKRRELELEETHRRIKAQKTYLFEKEESASTEISSIALKSEALTEALGDTYGLVISRSDWGNVDMLVHYIETGRADTIKEALQQVDQQRQTDQIVNAINAASRAMQNYIESALSRMGQALAEGFNRLDRSMRTVSMRLCEARRETLESNRQLLSKLDDQIDATQMNSVLLEKANESSDKLLEDLRYNQRFWVK